MYNDNMQYCKILKILALNFKLWAVTVCFCLSWLILHGQSKIVRIVGWVLWNIGLTECDALIANWFLNQRFIML